MIHGWFLPFTEFLLIVGINTVQTAVEQFPLFERVADSCECILQTSKIKEAADFDKKENLS